MVYLAVFHLNESLFRTTFEPLEGKNRDELVRELKSSENAILAALAPEVPALARLTPAGKFLGVKAVLEGLGFKIKAIQSTADEIELYDALELRVWWTSIRGSDGHSTPDEDEEAAEQLDI